ncbi:hypothetical protein [Kibdelosporangium phytohabitans]|uniref:Uncharacterized protein n=1 Tax=Kibdelosporangium phytohabitans TaxID=860235 RepID=A0A0N9ICG9_9PSEU|nr:hypothetical protein [Kibdelosporangium phytohabitans]ALG14011.1 hypothetical protein AOZ06_50455 [Kibdelosporangium phytohabitans]MBE1467034.1 hypothetical protein [Kibdelosporangium phytohabitans]
MTAQPKTASEQEPELPPLPPVRAKLNQPKRALVAAAELVVAAGLVWLAFWLWPMSVATITTVFEDGRPPLVSHRYFGHWMSLSVLSGTVAAVLVVDAVRQLVLASRARPKHRA